MFISIYSKIQIYVEHRGDVSITHFILLFPQQASDLSGVYTLSQYQDLVYLDGRVIGAKRCVNAANSFLDEPTKILIPLYSRRKIPIKFVDLFIWLNAVSKERVPQMSSEGLRYETNRVDPTRSKFAMCLIVRNEGPYILEWIAHYLCLGVSHFTIYDNQSDDDTSTKLDMLAKNGWIDHKIWSTPVVGSPQLTAYMDYIALHSGSNEFVGFFDADEFLSLPSKFTTLGEYFAEYDLYRSDVSAVAVNQRVFGSSGKKEFEPGLVIERFTRAATEDYPENRWFKSFARAARIETFKNPHFAELKGGSYVDVTGQIVAADEIRNGQMSAVCLGMRVNHYIIKSLGEFRIKQARGGAASATQEDRSARYTEDFFFGRDANLNRNEWRFPKSVIENVLEMEARLRRGDVRSLPATCSQ